MGKHPTSKSRGNETSNEDEREGQRATKVKVRYGETKQVKDMRQNFEKAEKIAMRSSRSYRYIYYLYPMIDNSKGK